VVCFVLFVIVLCFVPNVAKVSVMSLHTLFYYLNQEGKWIFIFANRGLKNLY
jgi:hypothetical protein